MKKDDQWRTVPGTDGLYEISVLGEVRSWNAGRWGRRKKPRMLRMCRDFQGRNVVKMNKGGKLKPVLIFNTMIATWFGGRPKGMSAYHKNGMKTDDRLENIGFAPQNSIRRRTGGMAGGRKVVVKMTPDYEIVTYYRSAIEAGRQNHMAPQTIRDHCNGRVKNETALDGHRYRYEEDLDLEWKEAL